MAVARFARWWRQCSLALPLRNLLLHDPTTAVLREHCRVLWISFAPRSSGLLGDWDDRIHSFVSNLLHTFSYDHALIPFAGIGPSENCTARSVLIEICI